MTVKLTEKLLNVFCGTVRTSVVGSVMKRESLKVSAAGLKI